MITVATSSFGPSGVQASKIGSPPNTTSFNLVLAGAYSSAWSIVFNSQGYN